MTIRELFVSFLLFGSGVGMVAAGAAETLPRAEWGAPLVSVVRLGNNWVIRGQKQTVTLDATSLELTVKTPATTWRMNPSLPGDLRLKQGGEELAVRLADAEKIAIAPFDSGAKTGLKLSLRGWKLPAGSAELSLTFTIALEGAEEELVFDVSADESQGCVVRQLD